MSEALKIKTLLLIMIACILLTCSNSMPLVILDVKAQPVPPIDPEPFTITTAIVLALIVILGIVIGILAYYKTNKTKSLEGTKENRNRIRKKGKGNGR
jgi:hypothetical protein